MDAIIQDIRRREAMQQPRWTDRAHVNDVRQSLASYPPLVAAAEVHTLRAVLADVARGEAKILQAGDCAESLHDNAPADVVRKAAVLDLLAGALRLVTQQPVVRVGRIAGQFAKPRSRLSERSGGVDLPVYRGDMVNGPEPTADSRVADPRRLLTGYAAAKETIRHLGWSVPTTAGRPIERPTWTSHEALLLDYEVPLLRRDDDGRLYLGSTHWPWIGERTRQPHGAHVALLAEVVNPVACKIGPSTTEAELSALCERLDPDREPGRLTLIARMGAGVAPVRLPELVLAANRAGHPVIWLTDPMHGNTIMSPGGSKTRMVETIVREVREFRDAVESSGGVAGGLHLETTPDEVTECATDAADLDDIGKRYTSLCDPRLTPWQAITVVLAWEPSPHSGAWIAEGMDWSAKP